jgi:hypothetical protein
MSTDYEKLKAIGAQRIHEETHIPRLHVQAILNKTYDDMSKIQFFGFISILEREYFLDLEELKEDSLLYFNEVYSNDDDLNNVFVANKQKDIKSFSYIIIGFLVFITIVYFSLFSSSQNNEDIPDIDESLIVSAQENMQSMKNNELSDEKEQEVLVPEIKQETTQTIINEKEQEVLVPEIKKETTQTVINEKEVETENFIIHPKELLWMGYKNLDTGESYQITTIEDIRLDSSKTWLLTFGHGYLDTIVDGKTTEYQSKYTIRFLYKDGIMNKITYRKFKELDAGGIW